jgi:hypothetical protein
MCIEPPLPLHRPHRCRRSPHHPVDVAALGDAVAVAAMGAGDVVAARARCRQTPAADRLLAGIEVHEAGDAAIGELDMHTLLELADRLHLTVGAQQVVAIDLQHRGRPLSCRLLPLQ